MEEDNGRGEERKKGREEVRKVIDMGCTERDLVWRGREKRAR